VHFGRLVSDLHSRASSPRRLDSEPMLAPIEGFVAFRLRPDTSACARDRSAKVLKHVLRHAAGE
jgi:hypothetical protein